MADMLDPDRAEALARRLALIPDFPRFGKTAEACIEACAEDLMAWCKNGFLDGEMWSAERKAEWVVTEARRQFRKWGSSADLWDLLQAKFRKPEGPAVRTCPVCPICGGTGWRIVEKITRRGPVSGAERCSCEGKAPVDVCPLCNGKESRLEGDKRVTCSCVGEDRRRQMEEIAIAVNSRPERKPLPAPSLPPGVQPITQADIDAELRQQGKRV